MLKSDSTSTRDLNSLLSELIALEEAKELLPSDLESRLVEALFAYGRHAMAKRLAALSPAEGFVDADTGVKWTVAIWSRLDVITMFGHVYVQRPLFRSVRNGPTRCVVSEGAELLSGLWMPRAASVAARCASVMPMKAATDLFSQIGIIGASRSSVLRLVQHVSELWEGDREKHEQAMRQEAEIPESATAATFSLDGVMIMTVDSDRGSKKEEACAQGRIPKGPAGWREASVGVVTFYDKDGERVGTRRYARMPEADKLTTKQWIRNEFESVKQLRPTIKTMALADGAANNWTFLESLGADHELVDFFHTCEHLHRHVSTATGAATLETQGKLKDMRHRLLTVSGAAEGVFAELQRLRKEAGTQAPSAEKTEGKRQPTYIDRHAGRMGYPEARALRLPIGSGVTESTCKWVVCDRLRGTGMRWSSDGGQAVMTLRAWLTSDQFESGWSIVMKANKLMAAARSG